MFVGFFCFVLFPAVLCSMRDLSSLTRIEPVPLQWKLGVLTTGPLGKSHLCHITAQGTSVWMPLMAARKVQGLLPPQCLLPQAFHLPPGFLAPHSCGTSPSLSLTLFSFPFHSSLLGCPQKLRIPSLYYEELCLALQPLLGLACFCK